METKALKGDWVQIHEIVLKAEDRTAKLPEDTKKVPVELWVKGFLNNEIANIGDNVEITTLTGRIMDGTMVGINVKYDYGFGDEYIPELLKVGKQLRSILKGGELNDR